VKFFSRRNKVTLRDGLVYKRLASAREASLEAAILRELRGRGVAVPEVLICRNNLMVLEYLPGDPLPDWIERGIYNPAPLAGALCGWFTAFYAAVPEQSRGDVNGRNFLYDGAKIYSVDFEERCYGSRPRDAGRLAAFIETYRTHNPERQATLASAFLCGFCKRFGCAMEEVMAERDAELEAIRERRSPPLSLRDISPKGETGE